MMPWFHRKDPRINQWVSRPGQEKRGRLLEAPKAAQVANQGPRRPEWILGLAWTKGQGWKLEQQGEGFGQHGTPLAKKGRHWVLLGKDRAC